jgi:hypothetical protein
MSIADMLRNELEVETKDAAPLSDIFSEEPPPLDSFISDKKFLDQQNVKLGDLQHDFVRHFEQILFPETYILMVEEFGDYWTPVRFCNEYALEWGKGSGKDFCAQISFARTSNILLCLTNPQQYYDLSPDTYVHMLNVAASAPQAHSVFFKPLRSMITRSPWFSDKFEGETPGPQATEIRFKKQIELISGHSQASTLEGKNLIAGIADEISEFPTEDEVAQSKSGRTPAKTAKAILSMLKTSGSTRFPETYRLAQISFPRYKGDAIEEAILKGKADNMKNGEDSRYFVSGPHATWVVNPRYKKYALIDYPGASQPIPDLPNFKEDYDTDPAEARAKYECRPELAENRFLNNDEAIFSAFNELRPVEPVTIEYYWGVDREGNLSEAFSGFDREGSVPGWQVKFHYAPDLRPMDGALYTLHGDLALTGDRAGVAMTHVRTWDRRDWPIPGGSVMLESRPVVKVDFVTAFEALKQAEPAPREVQIRWYRKLIWELRSRGFMIVGVSFDNFQSADSLQILESWGIETRKASTDRTNDLYNTLRDVLYDGRLEGYYHELLVSELRRLSKLKNGRIDHPPKGSKDLADALAGAVAWSVEVGGDEGEVSSYSDTDGIPDLYSDYGNGGSMSSLMPDGMSGMSLGLEGGGLGSMQW